jgi:uncharacterized protein YggE
MDDELLTNWRVPHVAVRGRATLTTKPDEALVTLGVGVQLPTLEEAQRTAAEMMTSVIDVVRGQGVAQADMRTRNYSVHPVEQRDKAGNRKGIEGYAVWNQLIVRVRGLDRLSTEIDTAIVGGANDVRGISFTVSDPVAVEGEARTLAVADARRGIEELAGAAGVTAGRVLRVGDGYSSAPSPRGALFAMEPRKERISTPIEAGEYEIAVEVEMVCEIEEQGK